MLQRIPVSGVQLLFIVKIRTGTLLNGGRVLSLRKGLWPSPLRSAELRLLRPPALTMTVAAERRHAGLPLLPRILATPSQSGNDEEAYNNYDIKILD
jgi:hypothetical protein